MCIGLFYCCIFSRVALRCTHFLLHFFHVALFTCCHLFMMHLFFEFHFFQNALYSYCTIFCPVLFWYFIFFSWCTVVLFLNFTFLCCYMLHLAAPYCCSSFKLHYFYVLFFSCHSVFIMNFFCGALFSSRTVFCVAMFSCCTFCALFSYCTFFHVAPFSLCISSSVALFLCCNFSCCIFFSLDLHFWPVFCFTLFMISFFTAAFSLTAHFSDYSFQVALFFSSTVLMLYSFHNALCHGHLPWCAYIVLRSFKAAIFHIAICSCCPISFLCIFFMLHISRRHFFLLYFLKASTIQFCFGCKLNKQANAATEGYSEKFQKFIQITVMMESFHSKLADLQPEIKNLNKQRFCFVWKFSEQSFSRKLPDNCL